jgi:subtilase family serine protease
MVGIYDLQIIVSDGDLNVTRNINVEVKSTADLVVDQVTYAGNISSGSMVDIEVHVRNSGLSDAYFVTVECRADGDLLKIVTLAEVKSGVIETAICPWLVQLEDDVALIDVVIDSGDDIFESDETNNDYSKSKSIEVISTTTPQNIAESTEISQNMVWAGTIGAVLLLIGLFIMFGPAPIRKIE